MALGKHLYKSTSDKMKSHSRLIIISRHKSRHLDSFFSLYETAFPGDQGRFSSAEILDWISKKARAAGIHYRILVVKQAGTVNAVAIYMRCKRRRVAFVPYLAVSDEVSGRPGARVAIKKLMKAVQPWFGWSYIIAFECENPTEPFISKQERNRRSARIRRFQQHCGALGVRMAFPKIRYIRPPYFSDDGKVEAKNMILGMVVPSQLVTLSRSRAAEILEYIITEVYVTCVPQAASQEFQDEVTNCYKTVKNTLDDEISFSSQPPAW